MRTFQTNLFLSLLLRSHPAGGEDGGAAPQRVETGGPRGLDRALKIEKLLSWAGLTLLFSRIYVCRSEL